MVAVVVGQLVLQVILVAVVAAPEVEKEVTVLVVVVLVAMKEEETVEISAGKAKMAKTALCRRTGSVSMVMAVKLVVVDLVVIRDPEMIHTAVEEEVVEF